MFIDVHKAIRRITPSPRNRVPKGEIVAERHLDELDADENTALLSGNEARRKSTDSSRVLGTSPQVKFLMRRSSSGHGSIGKAKPMSLRSDTPSELREHLKHLGPSNAASNPRSTRISTVKIKPSVSTIPEGTSENGNGKTPAAPSELDPHPLTGPTALSGGIGEGVLANSGSDARDGAHAVATSYGAIGSSAPLADSERPLSKKSSNASNSSSKKKIVIDNRPFGERRSNSSSTVGSVGSGSAPRSPNAAKSVVRSGSISENVIDVNGVKKMVLDVSSSSDDEQDRKGSSHSHHSHGSSHKNWGSSSGHSGFVNIESSAGKQPESEAGPANVDGSKDDSKDDSKDEDHASATGDSQVLPGVSGTQKKKRKKRANKKKKGTW